MMDKVPNKKNVLTSVMFSLFDFFTLEDGTKRLSHSVGKELPLYSA
jgi:hypothetical protein